MTVRYTIKNNLECDIKKCGSTEQPDEKAAIYILAFFDGIEELAVKIRRANPMNYVIVTIDDPLLLMKIITPQVSPSGYLMSPVNESKAAVLFESIISDYDKISGSSGAFVFKIKAREYSVPLKNILFFESSNKKVIIRTVSQEIECPMTLSDILAELPGSFMQIHKSYIINLNMVSTVDYGNMCVEFENGCTAFISRTYKAAFKEKMNERGGSV